MTPRWASFDVPQVSELDRQRKFYESQIRELHACTMAIVQEVSCHSFAFCVSAIKLGPYGVSLNLLPGALFL